MHLLVLVLVLIRDWSSLRKQQVGASQLVVKDHIAMVWLTRPHQLLPSLTKLIHWYLLHICHFEKVLTRNKPNYWTTHTIQHFLNTKMCSTNPKMLSMFLTNIRYAVPSFHCSFVCTLSFLYTSKEKCKLFQTKYKTNATWNENTNARDTTPMPLCLHSLHTAPLIPLYQRNGQNQRTFCQSVAARSFRFNRNCVFISIRENQA